MTDTTESRWFKISIVIASGAVVGVTIANVVYYNRIRNGTCNAMTKNEANVMFWINIVLLVIFILIFLWSLWRLLFTRELRSKVGNQVTGYLGGEATGVFGPRSPGQATTLSSTQRQSAF